MGRGSAWVVGIVVAACLAPATALGLGEPVDGYPSYPERVIHYLTNRARTAPQSFNTEGGYGPNPPLRWDLQLSKAARWQARHIIEASCWCQDHSSCCEIGVTDGQVACLDAPTGCGQTDAATRVGFFSNRYSGENAANGYASAAAAVDGWIDSPGHWANINSGRHTLLGPGAYQAGWVQVFGRDQAQPAVAVDGIHWSTGQSTSFGITYHQAGTGGPREAMVIVDGQCHDLGLAYGQAELGAFEQTLSLEPGCHRYYFHITDGEGNAHVYPSRGSLGVAVGSADACPLYAANRPADTCSPSGQSCETGHTRPCYTGPYGTEGVGTCQAGTERCIGGQWTGECRYEVGPEADDGCGDGLDDDCDGEVDETCAGGADAGGVADAGTALGSGADDDDDGCSTGASRSAPPALPGALVAALAVWGVARRRR